MTELIGWFQELGRFLDQSLSTASIGFRCAMDRLGPPSSLLKENQRKPVDWERKKGY